MPVKVSQTVLVSAVVLAALGSLLLTNLFYAALWKNDLQRVLGQWIRSHPAEDAVTNAAQIVKAHADSAAQIVKAHADSAAQTDDSNAATSISSKEIELAKCLVEADSFLASEMCWSIAKDKFMSSSLDLLRHVSKADLDHQFATVKGYAPHRLLLPTYSCDALKLQRIGGKYAKQIGEKHWDGPKWVCGEFLELPKETGKCTIFSIGSEGDFAFEEEMKKFTKDSCQTYTFDCTGNWTNPSTTFNSWCVSDKTFRESNGREYKTLEYMMAGVGVSNIDLFKIDVESNEFKVLNGLAKTPRHLLPKQMLIEVHFGYGGNPLTEPAQGQNYAGKALEFYDLVTAMGYKIAVRELNIFSECCAEYVLIRE